MVDILAIIVAQVKPAFESLLAHTNITENINIYMATETPEHPPDDYIIISRYGGAPSRYGDYDRPVISARVHAKTEDRAYLYARIYNRAMCDLVLHPNVSAVRPNAIALLSTGPDGCLYQVTHYITTI